MKILGINHIGLAASDPDKAAWFLGTILGLEHLGDEFVATQHTMTVMFAASAPNEQTNAPPSRLEILRPDDSEDSPIAKFLAKRGGGLHHLALSVANLDAALAHLANHKIEMIDKTPRIGAHATRIAFVHPRATGGILIELVENMG